MRLIDREILQMGATKLVIDGVDFYYARDIDHAPLVDAKPVVHGRWVWVQGPCDDDYSLCCSKCKCAAHGFFDDEDEYKYIYSNYCPNCGAKMDLEDE